MLLAAALAIGGLVGCGTNGPSSGAGASAADCKGTPLKFATFFSESGTLAVFGNDVQNAAKVATAAINAKCAIGRPIQVTVCDDQSTTNGSLQCGEKARQDGTLAILGLTAGPGGSDEGAQTADLPAVFTTDQTSWDNTSSRSYPDFFPLLAISGQVKAAKALGAKSFMLAAVDVPPAHVQASIGEASAVGIKFQQTYFPLDTTDFSSVAAQIVQANPGALDFLLPQPEQFIDALVQVGANFSKMHIIADQGILTPQQEVALKKPLEGAYEIGGVVPPSAQSNAAIKAMKAEYQAAKVPFSPLLSVWATQEWSAIHAVEIALSSLSKSAVQSLTSASLVKAVVAHGSYNVPGVAPFNYQSKPFPTSTPLGQGRIFSDYQGVFKLENGVSVPIGTWQNVQGSFKVSG